MILCDDQPRVTDVEHGHSVSNLKQNIPLRTITGGENTSGADRTQHTQMRENKELQDETERKKRAQFSVYTEK